MPAKRHAAHAQRPRSQSRSQSRPRLIALLIVGPLLCAIALTGLAYIGLSQQSQRDKLTQMGLAAQAAHGALLANMGEVKLANGQLTSALPANVTSLNNNNAEAQQLHALVGADLLIAQREQNTFVVVASSLAPVTGAAPGGLGARLGGAVAANACASTAKPTTATLTIGGSDYLAGSVALLDGSGACVGTVVALTPQNAIQTASLEYTVILAMAGALLALLTGAVGLALHGRGGAGEAMRTEWLRAAVASLASSEAACATQLEQRTWVARRLSIGRNHMQRLMISLASDRVALQNTTSDIWAGISHPGAPIDPASAVHLAREGAVVAARVGSRLNDIDAVAAGLFADLDAADEVDALLSEALAQTQAGVAELRALTDSAQTGPVANESASEPVSASYAGMPARPGARPAAHADYFATNVLEAQHGRTGQYPTPMPDGPPRQTRGYRAVRPESAQQRAPLGDQPTIGHQPAPGQSQQRRRASGMGASGVNHQQSKAGSDSHYGASDKPPAPRKPRQAPKRKPDQPPDGRNRDSSGSRWLND